jgi:hypothetical protein
MQKEKNLKKKAKTKTKTKQKKTKQKQKWKTQQKAIPPKKIQQKTYPQMNNNKSLF